MMKNLKNLTAAFAIAALLVIVVTPANAGIIGSDDTPTFSTSQSLTTVPTAAPTGRLFTVVFSVSPNLASALLNLGLL